MALVHCLEPSPSGVSLTRRELVTFAAGLVIVAQQDLTLKIFYPPHFFCPFCVFSDQLFISFLLLSVCTYLCNLPKVVAQDQTISILVPGHIRKAPKTVKPDFP